MFKWGIKTTEFAKCAKEIFRWFYKFVIWKPSYNVLVLHTIKAHFVDFVTTNSMKEIAFLYLLYHKYILPNYDIQ